MKQFQEDLTLSDEVLKSTSLNKNFEERSEIVQEIISRKRDFFEKWSLTIFLGVLLLIIVGTSFIRYPDIIIGNAMLTGDNAPKEIVPKKNGKLTALFVKNNQHVDQDEIIGWLESSASITEVTNLFEQLKNSTLLLNQTDPQAISSLFNQRYNNLGELQEPYQIFIRAWQEYNDYLVNGFYYRRKTILNSDIIALKKMKIYENIQKQFTQKDNELAKSTYEMYETLYKEKVISAEEYRKAQSSLINKQVLEPQMNVNIISKENQIRDKQKEIDQLNHAIIQQQKTFEQALYTLKSKIDEWLRQYTIQAPTDGTIIFVMPIQLNQYIQQGKVLGYVNPPNSNFYVQVKLPQNNFGKVDSGMKVEIRFDAYSYQEVGYLSGTLNYISDIAIDSGFLGTVILDKGLVTNQHKFIQYKPGLKGKALIITEDMRLSERLYYNIIKASSLNR